MADARTAILAGSKAAHDLLRDLHIREQIERGQGTRIDVFNAISRLGAALMFQPLDKLLGAYIPGDEPGVLITTQRQLPVQRFTGAHELGHLFMKHEPSVDDERILRRSPFAPNSALDRQEREADAFAAMFLVPAWLLALLMQRQQWTPEAFGDPHIVYQASLRLGTSYQATCHILHRNKVISRLQRDALLEVTPKWLKQDLLGSHRPANWHLDVWLLTERDEGALIEGGRDDLFVLRLNEHNGAGYLWNIDELRSSGFAILADEWPEEPRPGQGVVGVNSQREITLRSTSIGAGRLRLEERRPWQTTQPALNEFGFSYHLFGPEDRGLWAPQRRMALEQPAG